MMLPEITGKEINHVLAAVLDVEPADGNKQLSLLCLAMIYSCKQLSVPKETLFQQISEHWDLHMDRGEPIVHGGRA